MGRIHRLYIRRAPPLVLVMALAGTVLAQLPAAVSPETERAFSDFRGWFSINYWYSSVVGGNPTYGGSNGVLDGLTFGAGLEARFLDLDWALEVPYLSVNRQNLSLTVRNRTYSGSLEFSRVPPATATDARQIEFSLRNSLRLPDFPNVTMAVTHSAGRERSNTGINASLGDSYRDLNAWLPSLSWNVGYRFGRSSTAATAPRDTHSLQLRLQGELRSDGQEVGVRPALTARYRWNVADTTSFSQQYAARLESDSSDGLHKGALELGLRLSEHAETRFSQSLTYTSTHFDPLALDLGLDMTQQAGDNRADYRISVSYAVTNELSLGAGYRGLQGPSGPSNGVMFTASYRLTARPLTISSQATVDLQFPAAGGFNPSGSARLSLRYQGDPFNLAITGSINYATQGLRGRLETSAEYAFDAGGITFTGGLQLARTVSLDLGLTAHARIYRAWSLQADLGYRADFSEDEKQVLTVGLGLRYTFGGSE